jgi:catechol 2,3-dioxygenase-like lactoylglutathione lyase family enzyme
VEVQALGHVVVKVRDRRRSEDFYSSLLGMRIISRISNPPMTFFSVGGEGPHHD